MALNPTVSPKKDGSFDYPKPLGLHGVSVVHILNSKGVAYCSGKEWPAVKKLATSVLVCFDCRKVVDKLPKKQKKDED